MVSSPPLVASSRLSLIRTSPLSTEDGSLQSTSELFNMKSPGYDFLFTSESVNEGHPDKLCDQVSDAILDACLSQDPQSKVACECCAKNDTIIIFGEISTNAKVNYEQVVRDTVKNIGYNEKSKGLDYKTMKVMILLDEQSPEIASGVHISKAVEDIGAGDQGHMFGYACDETEELMPLSHSLATHLGKRLTELRKDRTLPYLRPDGKTQVTVAYKLCNGVLTPEYVHTVVISTQHDPDVTNEVLREDLMEHVIKHVIPKKYIRHDTIYHLNPSGRFVIGGPYGDAGLTGRKIIVDTYGGWGAHGGGAFSGKDATKVDRSAAYAVRWAAKSLVASGLCRRCLVQVSYAISLAKPLSMFVDSYGTVKEGYTDRDLLDVIESEFDFRPGCIQKNLRLTEPIFCKTAAYGHFGRDDESFLWEVPKKLKFLRDL